MLYLIRRRRFLLVVGGACCCVFYSRRLLDSSILLLTARTGDFDFFDGGGRLNRLLLLSGLVVVDLCRVVRSQLRIGRVVDDSYDRRRILLPIIKAWRTS